MKLLTKFGELEFPEEDVLAFPNGLPGFTSHRFLLFHRDETPIVHWLQSVDEPDVALMTVEPRDLLLDYAPDFESQDVRAVCPPGAEGDTFAVRLIIRNADDAPGHLRVNLFAPLLFNVGRRLGMQVPLLGTDYPVSALWPPASSPTPDSD